MKDFSLKNLQDTLVKTIPRKLLLKLDVNAILENTAYDVDGIDVYNENVDWYLEQVEKIAEYKRRYREENKEKIAEYHHNYHRRWRELHKEELAEYNRNYRKVNADAIAELKRRWEELHKEERAERSRRYRKENKEKIAEYGRQYYDAQKE